MNSRFPKRVALERQALDCLNECNIFRTPLVGFSTAAIDRWWASSVVPSFGAVDSQHLRTALLSIAHAARAEADISDEIFVDIREDESSLAIDRLRKSIERLRREIESSRAGLG